MNKKTVISVIVPFYHGNRHLSELCSNLEKINHCIESFGYTLELVFVNDSPDEKINLPVTSLTTISIINDKNRGIHYSRVAGLKSVKGEWIIFLDQDDLLIPENYTSQVQLCKQYPDVIVGNGYYYRNNEKKLIFKNRRVMDYQVSRYGLFRIRNLIPSTGETLIRRSAIPVSWQENILSNSGTDDWMLWLMMFGQNARIATNAVPVYIHRSTDSGNLSFDLNRMKTSAHEMVKVLKKTGLYSTHDLHILSRAIDFKYYQDTRTIKLHQWFYYIDRVIDNIIYKLKSI